LPISFVHIESKSYNTPSAMVVPDPVLLGKFMLVLVGSDGDDFITVRPIQKKDRFLVNIDGGPSLLFDFVTGHIKVTANKGDDYIYIQPSVKNPTIIDGGAGNDFILSGAGDDVITSGLGSDTVDAGAGKDRLVEAGDVNMTLVQGTARVNGSLTSGPDTDVLIKNRIESAHLTGGPSANTLDASGFRLPVFLFGLGGNDTLIGTNSRDILVGGDGDDSLSGFGGVDILIGGLGLDILIGGGANDLLIGGNTLFDANTAALEAIMSEWARTNVGYPGRINHLLGTAPGGKNGAFFLNNTTVFDDLAVDNLTGGTKDRDWYITSLTDIVTGLQPTETVTSVP
jgi:Ca2+-binding RTX toxin-like protein